MLKVTDYTIPAHTTGLEGYVIPCEGKGCSREHVDIPAAWVCSSCYMTVEYGEAMGVDPDPRGQWNYVGHHWEECEHWAGEYEGCNLCDGESSPRWVCDGCGLTNVMFEETHLVVKQPD